MPRAVRLAYRLARCRAGVTRHGRYPALPDPKYSLGERARRFLLREYWNIGVVGQSVQDIARRGIVAGVRWLPPPPRGTILADPACLAHADGGRTLFAEWLDHRAPRGEIWAATLAPGEDPVRARFAPLLAGPRHMSYPRPFTVGGRRLLMCESWRSGGIPLWEHDGGRKAGGREAGGREAGGREDGWRPLAPLLAGRQPLDPTLLRWQGRWWLFCTLCDDQPNARLHIFHAPAVADAHPPETRPPEILAPDTWPPDSWPPDSWPPALWEPHAANPVRVDSAGARPAGPLFLLDGLPVRPGQDSSRTYGGAVVLHAITRLTPDAYEERVLRRLDPPDARYPHGLHTLCPAGEVTLIDGKRWGTDPTPAGRQILARARRILRRPPRA